MRKLTWTALVLLAMTVFSMSSVPVAADVIQLAISAQTDDPALSPPLTMQGTWYWDRTNGTVSFFTITVSGGQGYDPHRYDLFTSSAQVFYLTDCENCACAVGFEFSLFDGSRDLQIEIGGTSVGMSCAYEGSQQANAEDGGLDFNAGTVTRVGAGAEAGLGLTASVNQPTFAVGQMLRTSATVSDPGLQGSADLYVGVLLPDGVTIVFWTGAGHTERGRLTDVSTFRPYASGVSLATPFSSNMPDFFTHQWTGGEPRGRYIFFHLAMKAGALAGGAATSHDMLGLVTAPFSFP